MEKEFVMTRRSALMAVPAMGATLLSFPAAGKASPHDTSTVDGLIKAHKAAWQTFEDRCSEVDELETAYRAERQLPMTAMAVAPDGRPMRGHVEVDLRYPNTAVEMIKKEHQQLLGFLAGPIARRLAPEAADALEAALRSSQRRSLLRLRATVRRELKQQEEFGVTAAKAEYEEMACAEHNTLKALLAYSPRNAAEAERKAEHISWYRNRGYDLTDDQLDALMLSVAGQFAA